MNNCIFCKIVNKEIPSKIIYENDDLICFLPKEIEVYGHTLVAPKRHYSDLYDIPADLLCEIVKAIQKLAIDYKEKINSAGMNVMHASGKDGQQTVSHFHFHLLPRFKNDGLNTWPILPKNEFNAEEILQKLK
jgi:histidine triad (HIT) family protein